MIRRVSTVFKKSKNDNKSKKSETDSATNGSKKSTTNGTSKDKAPAPLTNGTDGNDHPVKRTDVEGAFEKYAPLIHASRGPLPAQSGDGSYLDHEEPSGLFQDLKAIGFKDVATLRDYMKNKTSGELVDDKTMIMERIIQLVSGLPPHSKNRIDLTNSFLDELWNSLPHPPLSYVGDDYNYRSADGSNNNPLLPKLGAANTPYARSTIPSTQQPGALPDPGLIFDSLFARQKFTPHPNKVSSIFFDWASLVIHDLFQTDPKNPHMSKTSSYLDLSILYGDNQEDQNQMRTFKDGKLKPDSFAEQRLIALPPACCVMLIMLNRFHNHAVEQLAAINEGGRFTKPRDGLPSEMAEKAWAKYDNDLFQTGRLIVCGLYINITLYDYLRTIVNLNRTNTTWCLDPRVKMEKSPGKEATPVGLGNQCSAEFNLAYRWHSAISSHDETWINGIYKDMFGKPADEVSMQDLVSGLGKWSTDLPKDPSKRNFAHLKRQEDGTFNDDELVKIMTEGVEDVAGSFGARNVPKALRAVEILGMMQARKWQCGSLNEFRKFFGLKEYDSFEDINPDPDVAEALRNLYEHPDFVELYPGLVSEDAKDPMAPGVGICPSYTISRAVLSDAVALVRGDRFYTTDFHAKGLTNWGFQETSYDLSINQGCMFYKLMLRAFPNHFKHDSIYAHYPMTIPEENKKIMKDLGRENDYSWDRPEYTRPRVELTSYQGAKAVLDNAKDYKVTWGEATGHLFGKGGRDFMLSGDTALHAKQRQVMEDALFQDEWKKHVKEFYEQITLKLLKEKSCKLAGVNQVDITRDVGNLAHVHFASNLFGLPLKSEDGSRGIYTEHELFMVLAVIYTCIFFDLDPPKSFALRQAASAVAQQLGNVVESHVKSSGGSGFLSTIVENFRHHEDTLDTLSEYGSQMIKKLLENGLGASEITWSHILPTASAMVPNQAQVFTQIIDFYLSEEGKAHLPEINRLAKENTPESEKKLLHYCMEGIRLNGTFGSYREATTSATVDDGDREVSIETGDRVFVSFSGAARDANVFPSPDEVRLDRDLDSYIHYGEGSHTSLGKEISMVALTSMLKVVGRLENPRRAPGPQGELRKIPMSGGFHVYLKEDHGGSSIFPTSMKIHYDGKLPKLSGKSS